MKKIVILGTVFLLNIFNAFSIPNEFNFVAGKNVYKNDKIAKVTDKISINDKIVCGPYSFCNLSFNDVKIFMYPQSAIYLSTKLEDSNNFKTTNVKHIIGKIKIESKDKVILYTTDKTISFKNSQVIINVENGLTTVKKLTGVVNIYYTNNSLVLHNNFQLLDDFEKPICSLLDNFYFNGVEYSERSIPLYYKKTETETEVKEEDD